MLVITPMTIKAYKIIIEALNSNMGSNAYGPAGTGKSETAKNFA
jgi:hypothetical protein